VIIGLGSLTAAKLTEPALSIYSPLVLCPNCPNSGKPNEYKVPLQSSKTLNSPPQPTFTIGGPLYLTYKLNEFFYLKIYNIFKVKNFKGPMDDKNINAQFIQN